MVVAAASSAHAAAKSCDFEFTPYQGPPTVLPAAAEVHADGWAQCDVTPDEHILTLSLEYKEGGKWVTANSNTDATLPPAPPNRYSYPTVKAACYAGTWRMAVSVTGKIGGNPFVFSDYSATRDIPTSDCPARF
ncbi:hypothetical protein GFY24_03770 [Nocardia sp. SYP-A9097]|uniref:hypothetical protein n=1 Tax=Nocardia sp. SYP-A9097 TaxID=2663237 RepID=UPI00129B7374|nr:hypothetical protein [Nocardia sp. SYP-A9097]MRH86596.1 hypothetical protein [Nocardia sp. SYP-A9097]